MYYYPGWNNMWMKLNKILSGMKRKEDMAKAVALYDDAFARGDFKMVKRLLHPETIEYPTSKFLSLIDNMKRQIVASKLARHMKYLSGMAGENLNSPLLDMFGPIQSESTMRAMRKNKYLQGDEGI